MKKPDVSRNEAEQYLAGTNGRDSWVHGRNCVYHDTSGANYRVSILTASGWKAYGHFNDLETATYVANIAILAEGCEGRYELNRGVGSKDRQELERWRGDPQNAALESRAKNRFAEVQSALEEAEKELQALREASERRARARIEEREANAAKEVSIKALSNLALLKFLRETGADDQFHDVAMREAVRRYDRLGLQREQPKNSLELAHDIYSGVRR